MSIEHNRDLSARLASLITSTGIERVTEHQPVRWRHAAWQNHWQAHRLPRSHMLDELKEEYAAYDTIRRSFVFTYRDRDPVEFFIAVMAWGLGPDSRGPAKVGTILTVPGAAATIKAVVDSVRQDGAAAGYMTYYSGPRLPQLNIAFITRLLYFAGYQEPHRPRPPHLRQPGRHRNHPAARRAAAALREGTRHHGQLPGVPAVLLLGRADRSGPPNRPGRRGAGPVHPRPGNKSPAPGMKTTAGHCYPATESSRVALALMRRTPSEISPCSGRRGTGPARVP